MERNEIFTAKTLDEAKQLAVEAFKVDELDIDFEIIEQPKKGLFGSKGEFRIRATHTEVSKSNSAAPVKSRKSVVASEPSEPADPSQFKHIIGYVEKILAELGVSEYKINIKKVGENNVIDITGEKLGIIIGRRGETLDALQYLAILANNRGDTENTRPRLLVDCNGYREKRTETLESLAIRTSAKVIKQGRRITLEPMNPYERRIIHSKISGIDGVYSNSVGDEPYRKVVISAEIAKRYNPDGPNKGGHRAGGFRNNTNTSNNRGSRNDRDRDRDKDSTVVLAHTPGAVSSPVQSKSYKKSAGFSTSFERDYKRAAAPEISQDTVDVEKNTSLYGKIEL
jgi:spoIIIJ-associated protein